MNGARKHAQCLQTRATEEVESLSPEAALDDAEAALLIASVLVRQALEAPLL